MAQVRFACGDTVRLKSGGPLLTVERTDGEMVTCVWFDGNQERRGEFVSDTLDISTFSTSPREHVMQPGSDSDGGGYSLKFDGDAESDDEGESGYSLKSDSDD